MTKRIMAVIGLALMMAGAAPVSAELPAWLKDIKFNGSLRVRWEKIDNDIIPTTQTVAMPDRDRFRYMGMLGFTVKPDDEVEVGVTLGTNGITGGSSIVSQMVTLDDYFNDDPLFVDKFYLRYTPAYLSGFGLSLAGGKFAQPWRTERFVWDTDISPEGGYVMIAPPSMQKYHVSLMSGAFVMDEVNNATGGSRAADGYLLGHQLRFGIDDVGPVDLGFWASNYHFIRENLITTTNNNSAYQGRLNSDFNLIDFGSDLTFAVQEIPIAVAVQWTQNERALVNPANGLTEDEALTVSLGIGKIKDRGDWAAKVWWTQMESDAAIGMFVDGDLGATVGGTNYEGWRAALSYGVTKNSALEVTYFHQQPMNNLRVDPEQQILQVDYVVKF